MDELYYDTLSPAGKGDPKPKPPPPGEPEPPPSDDLPPKDTPKPKPPPPAPHRVPLASSNLAAVTYDFLSHVLVVEFHRGGTYQYFGVPWDTYHALIAAGSHGGFFAKNIRYRFSYGKV